MIKTLWEDVGKPILVGRPGASGTIKNSEKYFAENDASGFRFGDGESCLSAAFINLIEDVREKEVDRRSYDGYY